MSARKRNENGTHEQRPDLPAIEIRRAPKPGARDRFVDLLWEIAGPDILAAAPSDDGGVRRG